MPIDRVIVNASPLICLFKCGLQVLLPGLFQDIFVPEAVLKEVTASNIKSFFRRLRMNAAHILAGKLRYHDPS